MKDKILPWKIVSSEYLYNEPWFTVRKETMLLPNGNVIPSYYVLEYPAWINVIGITKEGEMILIQQYRQGIGKISFELAAGVCDKEKTSILENAKRELLEETGYGNGNWKEWMTISANPATHNNLSYSYLATELELVSDQQLDNTEQISVHLFSKAEVKRMLINNEIIQALHAAPLWKYFALHPTE